MADLFVGTRQFDLMRWSIAWAGMIFLFFSISNSKLPGYIVPAFPALAIVPALALEKMPTRAVAWSLGVNLADRRRPVVCGANDRRQGWRENARPTGCGGHACVARGDGHAGRRYAGRFHGRCAGRSAPWP
ncbi:hypothetical protein ACU4HD_43400 [Cupriavidus basilensis]